MIGEDGGGNTIASSTTVINIVNANVVVLCECLSREFPVLLYCIVYRLLWEGSRLVPINTRRININNCLQPDSH